MHCCCSRRNGAPIPILPTTRYSSYWLLTVPTLPPSELISTVAEDSAVDHRKQPKRVCGFVVLHPTAPALSLEIAPPSGTTLGPTRIISLFRNRSSSYRPSTSFTALSVSRSCKVPEASISAKRWQNCTVVLIFAKGFCPHPTTHATRVSRRSTINISARETSIILIWGKEISFPNVSAGFSIPTIA